jgi:hypothetical protein
MTYIRLGIIYHNSGVEGQHTGPMSRDLSA